MKTRWRSTSTLNADVFLRSVIVVLVTFGPATLGYPGIAVVQLRPQLQVASIQLLVLDVPQFSEKFSFRKFRRPPDTVKSVANVGNGILATALS
jgi:hypothetical protein